MTRTDACAAALACLLWLGCGGRAAGEADAAAGNDAAAVDAGAGDAAAADGATGDGAPADAPAADASAGDASPGDATGGDAAEADASIAIDAGGAADAPGADAASPDAPLPPDAAVPADAALPPDAAPPPDAMTGVIGGGPCMSGSAGATAYRVRWANGSGTAYPVYEVNGLPDTSRDKTGAYGYQIGFKPAYVDTFLAQGGLQLDGSSFVDIELSTAGVAQIHSASLAIYGRSYNTTTSGSFTWQSFSGAGAAPTNLVSNAAPYTWYAADMTSAIAPNDDKVLLRIKAGPSSGSLVVNRIELCLQAD